MRRCGLLNAATLAAFLLSAPSSPATAAEDLRALAATSPWNLRYDEDKCRMVRRFGEGDDQIILMLDQAGVEPFYTLTLVGRPVRQANGRVIRIAFGNEQPTERTFLRGKLKDGTPLIAMHGVTLAPVPPLPAGAPAAELPEVAPIGPEREAAIERITFTGGPDKAFALEVGPMGEVFGAMRTCVADLVKFLEPDPSKTNGPVIAPSAKDNPQKWMTSDDYPEAMLRDNKEGMVLFRLTVDKHGKATSCHIARSSRPQSFDDTVCLALLKRARFKPALDAQGRPVAAYWNSAARFEIPD